MSWTLNLKAINSTKLREAVLSTLSPGLQEHTLTAVWNYIILCEIAEKIRDNDYAWAQRDLERWGIFEHLMDVYGRQVPADAGDFSERLLRLVDRLIARLEDRNGPSPVTGGELTQTLFQKEIRELEEALAPYLRYKEDVWLLIDNLDKGWPTRGASDADIMILRTLMDATRKLQRQLEQREVGFHALVFLRNDIYDHLLTATSDRGKDTAITLDWADEEVFKEIIKRRVETSTDLRGSFDDVWSHICDRYIGTQNSFRYMLSRTLMRPRDLLNFLHDAIGVAINRGHDRVSAADIEKAEESYSEGILLNTAFELRDIDPDMLDVLYTFNRAAPRMSLDQVLDLLKQCKCQREGKEIIPLLVWFGFLGVQEFGQEEATYSYQARYNVEKLMTSVHRSRAHLVIHPAYRKSLQIAEQEYHPSPFV